MTNRKKITSQIVMNTIPLLGVIFAQWSIFALIYSYWLETLSIVFFNTIKILTAQKSSQKAPHIKKALFNLMINLGELFFYLIFIVVFIGGIISTKHEGMNFINYLAFIDNNFKIMIFGLFTAKLLELIYFYFLNGTYKITTPEEYCSFFSPRIIVLHVVIVLGYFTFEFFSEQFSDRNGIIAFAVVFVIVKSIADAIMISISKNEAQDNATEIFL